MGVGPVKSVEPTVATHPATPARRSVTRTVPSGAVTVWALALPDAPRGTVAVGALMPSAPPVITIVTGVPGAVAAEAGTARASTPAPPMNSAVAVAIIVFRILLTPDGVF